MIISGIWLNPRHLESITTTKNSRNKLKMSEYRGEQAEMNIQRLNVRIDQVVCWSLLSRL